MINIQHEKLMTFTEAAALVPKRRQGRKVSQATLWRWHTKGQAGIRLEALRLPGGHVTSAQAIQRFMTQLTQRLDGSLPPNDPTPPPASTNPQVEKELDRAGI